MDKEKSIYGNVKVIKPRVKFPTPTPFEEKLHRDNMELIKFLNNLKNKIVWFK